MAKRDEYGRKMWVMPKWMEPMREMILDTGGNPVEELVNDRTTQVQTNVVRALLCVSVKDQVHLLYSLARNGMLKNTPTDAEFTKDLV